MADRYDTAIRGLQTLEPPDQWQEIRERADRGLIVPLNGDGHPGGRRRWPKLLAAAAVLAVVAAAAALLVRDDNDDVRTDPDVEPAIEQSSTTTEPPQTTTTDDAAAAETAEDAEAAAEERAAEERAAEEAAEQAAEEAAEFPACPVDLGLTTSTPPAGWSATMAPRDAGPEIQPPSGNDEQFAGTFSGPNLGQYVYVSVGLLNRQDDGGNPTPGPIPGEDPMIFPYPIGSYTEVFIPHPAGNCWVTLEATMTPEELAQFVQGLQGS